MRCSKIYGILTRKAGSITNLTYLPKIIMKRKKGYFSISAVAKMFSIHQQTIRLYEKEGLITPKRSEGNTRLFSEEDVDRLEEIIYLTHELGINLAGVEMILRLQRQIKKMQKEMNALFKNAQNELTRESETSKQLIKAAAHRLTQLKKNTGHEPIEPDWVEVSDETNQID